MLVKDWNKDEKESIHNKERREKKDKFYRFAKTSKQYTATNNLYFM